MPEASLIHIAGGVRLAAAAGSISSGTIEESNMTMPRIAWTGGSNPRPWPDTSPLEREIVLDRYTEQAREWLGYWGEVELPNDQHEIFWKRARYDAHATLRSHNG